MLVNSVMLISLHTPGAPAIARAAAQFAAAWVGLWPECERLFSIGALEQHFAPELRLRARGAPGDLTANRAARACVVGGVDACLSAHGVAVVIQHAGLGDP